MPLPFTYNSAIYFFQSSKSGSGGCIFCLGATIVIALVIWVVVKQYSDSKRKASIMARKNEWGESVCETILNKRITIGMNEEMVTLAWGRPAKVETKEVSASGQKIRWVYGRPRKGANYIWFTNGRVSKIQQ